MNGALKAVRCLEASHLKQNTSDKCKSQISSQNYAMINAKRLGVYVFIWAHCKPVWVS